MPKRKKDKKGKAKVETRNMRRLRHLMGNTNSSDDTFMELSDDYTEEVKGTGVGDGDITASASEVEQEPERPQNPFFQFCKKELKGLEKRLEKEKSKEFSEKQLTSALAKRWRKLPTEKQKLPSASMKWYHEEFLDPLLRDDVKEEDRATDWERKQLNRRVVKNLYVDMDKAEMLVRIGNARTQAKCVTESMGVNESESAMIHVSGPMAEVNLAINLMSDEETRLKIAMAVSVPKHKIKRYTRGQVDIEKRRQKIADCLVQGKKVPWIMKELGCSEKLVYKVKKMMKNNESLEAKTINNPGRPRIRSKEFLSSICHAYGADPFLSYTKAADGLGVGKMTISRSIHQLGLKSYVRRIRCLISTSAKQKRVERCEDLVQWLEDHPATIPIFSDKVGKTHIS